MTCPQCGADNPGNNRFCMKCGTELPSTVASEPAAAGFNNASYAAPSAMPSFAGASSSGMVWRQDQLASFGTRFVGIVIDVVLLFIVNVVLSVLHLGALAWLVGTAYYIYFWSTTGQTIGDMVMQIKVVRADGQPLSISTGILRYVGYFVSAIPLCLGFLWAAFDSNRQGWHDKIASTAVIRAG